MTSHSAAMRVVEKGNTMLTKNRLLGLGAIISAAFVLTACDNGSASTDEDGPSGGSAAAGPNGGNGGTGAGQSGGNGGNGGNGASMQACESAADCNDDDSCTDDACEAESCVYVAVEIDDQDECTVDACDASAGVTHTTVDPDDQDACTVDSCDTATGVSHVAVDIDDLDACTADSCDAATGIAHTIIDPDDANACTLDSCDSDTGVQNAAEIVLFSESFANNSQAWIVGAEWMIGEATASTAGQWGADPDTDHTGDTANGVAGAVIGGNVTTAQHGFYYITSPAINSVVAEGHVTLSYWRWLNSDYDPFMHNIVQVWDGSQWHTLWESTVDPGVQDSPPFGEGWVEYRFDVTDHQHAGMKVRFGHSVNAVNAFSVGGWNLDDVAVLHTAYAADDDPCTADSCDPTQGVEYTPLTNDDQSACTDDACNTVLSVHHLALDPNDGNACTTDSCSPSTGISNAPLTCNDQDSCTANSCDTTFGCVYNPIPQPHDKCEFSAPNTPLMNCPSDTCVQQVCAQDSFCCNNDWDSDCVNQVFTVCQSKSCNASAGTCGGSICDTTTTPRVSGCDAGFGNCVAQVCAVDSFCCSNSWDSICVGQVASVCGYNCN